MRDSKEHPEIQHGGLWYADKVGDFKTLATLPAPGVAVAANFTTIAVNVPKYIKFLLRHVRDHANAKVVRHSLSTNRGFGASIGSAHRLAHTAWQNTAQSLGITAVVNASGLQ